MEWLDEIRAHIDLYSERRTQISTALSKVIKSISLQLDVFKANASISDEDNIMSWDVTITTNRAGVIEFNINLNEILNTTFDDAGYPERNEFPENIEEVLQSLVVAKIKECLPIN